MEFLGELHGLFVLLSPMGPVRPRRTQGRAAPFLDLLFFGTVKEGKKLWQK